MAARHTKPKQHSLHETLIRYHHKKVRELKGWCENNNIPYFSYNEAEMSDICVCSKVEYELHDTRQMCCEDNESYFLHPEDYEKWCEE